MTAPSRSPDVFRVTPRFPTGLAVLHVSGHWSIVCDESPGARRLIDQIAAICKARFHQESVMIVRAPAFGCF